MSDYADRVIQAGFALGLGRPDDPRRKNPVSVDAVSPPAADDGGQSWAQRLLGGLPHVTNPAAPPIDPERSHGGGLVSAMVNGAISGATLPRDVYTGAADLNNDDDASRILDMTGMTTFGTTAAPAGALGSGFVLPKGGSSPSQALQNLRGLYENTSDLIKPKTIDWQDLQGKVMIPVQGDRTQAGQRLMGTEAGRFETPIDLQGGRNFSRAEAAQGPDASGWASTASGAKPLHSRTQRVADETGLDPVWAYMPLSNKSSDFTRLGWRTYEQLLRQRGGEDAMGAVAKDMPFAPTIDAMRKWYEGATGGERSTAFKKLATKGRANAAGVEPDEVRALIRDPELAGAREGDVGYGFIEPTGTITGNAAVPHMDYQWQLGGRNIGALAPEHVVPREQAFADAFAANPAWHEMPTQMVDHGFKTKLPHQIIDQQMVDRMMQMRQLYQGQ